MFALYVVLSVLPRAVGKPLGQCQPCSPEKCRSGHDVGEKQPSEIGELAGRQQG